MADALSEVIVKMGADFSEFLSEAKEAIGGMEGIKSAIEALNESFLGFVGLELSLNSLREFIELGVEMTASTERATEALTALTGDAETAGNALEELHAQAYDLGTAFDPLVPIEQRLKLFGLTFEQIHEFMNEAADTAKIMGTSVGEAGHSMERMLEGGTLSNKMLQRYGLTMKDFEQVTHSTAREIRAAWPEMTATEKAEILKQVEEISKLRNAHLIGADDITSSLARAGQAWHDFAELVVGAVFKVIDAADKWIQKNVEVAKAKPEKPLITPPKPGESPLANEPIITIGPPPAGGYKLPSEEQVKANAAMTEEQRRKKIADDEAKRAREEMEATGALYHIHEEEQKKIYDAKIRSINLDASELDKQKQRGMLVQDELQAEEDLARRRSEAAVEMQKALLPLTKPPDEAAHINDQLNQKILDAENAFQVERNKLVARGLKDSTGMYRSQKEREYEDFQKVALAGLGETQKNLEMEQRLHTRSAEDILADLKTNENAQYEIKRATLQNTKALYDTMSDADIRKRGDINTRLITLGNEHDAAQAAFGRKVTETQHAEFLDRTKAQGESLDAQDDRAKKSIELQRTLAEQDVQNHRMTLADKYALDVELDRQESELELNAIGRKIREYERDHANDADFASKHQALLDQQAKAEQQTGLQARQRAAEFADAQERALGIQTVSQMQNNLLNVAQSFENIRDAATKAGEALTGHDLAAMYEKLIEMEHDLFLAQGKRTDAYLIAEANFKLFEENEKYRLEGLGMLYQTLQDDVRKMWDEWAAGFAKAIVDGKKFGDVMMNVLKQIENQILVGIIGNALHQAIAWFAKFLKDTNNPILVKIGGFLGGDDKNAKLVTSMESLNSTIRELIAALRGDVTMAGRNPNAPGPESVKNAAAGPVDKLNTTMGNQTKATASQTAATVAGVGAAASMVGSLIANISGNKELAKIMAYVGAALSVLTTVLEINTATHFLFQHGGVVPGMSNTVVRAMVHGGEIVANESMMRNLGQGIALGNTAETMRHMAALTASGPRVNAAEVMQLLANAPSKTAGGTVSFDGATFHGVPDQRYVGQIMDSAVRQLRNSSRSWAFNPTGT